MKPKYDTHVVPRLKEIEWWCREGLIEKEICKRLDVCVDSFWEYKKTHPELVEALKNGKQIADYTVEDSLYKRANGYDYEETVIEAIIDKDGNDTKFKNVKRIKKHMAPDSTACIFWLKNRRPDKWRDKQEITGAGGEDLVIKVKHIKAEETDGTDTDSDSE